MCLWKVTVMSMILAFKKLSLKKEILSENTDARESGNFRGQLCDILQDFVQGLYRTHSKQLSTRRDPGQQTAELSFHVSYATVHTSKLINSAKSTKR